MGENSNDQEPCPVTSTKFIEAKPNQSADTQHSPLFEGALGDADLCWVMPIMRGIGIACGRMIGLWLAEVNAGQPSFTFQVFLLKQILNSMHRSRNQAKSSRDT